MNERRWCCEQGGEPRVTGLAKNVQPRKPVPEGRREFKHAARPAAIIFRVVSPEEGERRVLQARRLRIMELGDPTGRFHESARLAGGSVVTEIADAHRVVNVFKDEPSIARFANIVGAETLGTEIRQRPQHLLINFRFIANIAAVTVGIVPAACLVLHKQPPLAAVRQDTRDNLIRERTHESRKLAFENPHAAGGSISI